MKKPDMDCHTGGCPVQFLVFFVLLVVLDQISKWYVFEIMLKTTSPLSFIDWMTHGMTIEETVASLSGFRMIEVTSFFNLVAVWNTGVSFGLLQGSYDVMPALLTVFAFAMTGIMAVWGMRTTVRIERAAALLIAAGAFANALDRLRFKAVADFLDFHIGGWHWPAFNLADSCIVLGAGLLLVYILFGHPQQGTKK